MSPGWQIKMFACGSVILFGARLANHEATIRCTMTFDHGRCLLGIVGSSSHSICLSVSIRPFLSPATPQMGIWYRLHALPLLSPASLAADLEQAYTPTWRGARCPPSLETCLLTEEQRKSIRRTQPIQQSLCHAALCSLGLDCCGCGRTRQEAAELRTDS